MLSSKVVWVNAIAICSILPLAIDANASVRVNFSSMVRSPIDSTNNPDKPKPNPLVAQSVRDMIFNTGRFNSNIPKANQYTQRALLKYYQQQDYNGAIADLYQATELDPNFALAYYLRSSLKYDKLNDRYGGIADM